MRGFRFRPRVHPDGVHGGDDGADQPGHRDPRQVLPDGAHPAAPQLPEPHRRG